MFLQLIQAHKNRVTAAVTLELRLPGAIVIHAYPIICTRQWLRAYSDFVLKGVRNKNWLAMNSTIWVRSRIGPQQGPMLLYRKSILSIIGYVVPTPPFKSKVTLTLQRNISVHRFRICYKELLGLAQYSGRHSKRCFSIRWHVTSQKINPPHWKSKGF